MTRPAGTPVAMEFHQLRYFVAAAELGSMTAAARREHVTQPALSRQIALLETQLGVALFERRRQRIHLTEAGRCLLPRARQLLCDADTAAQQLRERFGKARRTLRLGCLGTFLDDLVAPVVRELAKKQRGLQVAVFDLSPRAQLERLAADELDVAILANLEPEHPERFAVRALGRHRMAAALPETHALSARAAVALAELADQDWVSLADASFPGRREFLRTACAAAGFEPRIVHEADSVALLLGAVAAGYGIAIVPEHSRKVPHAGCVFVPLRPPAPAVELLALTARGAGDTLVRALLDALQARARSLASA